MDSNAIKSEHSAVKAETEDLVEFFPFNPTLNDYYKNVFNRVSHTTVEKFHSQRVDYLKEITDDYNSLIDDENLEGLKLLTSLRIMKDLLAQGWRMRKGKKDEILLAPPKLLRGDSKQYLRQQLENEKNAQFKIESIKKFILKMEKNKNYKGKTVSILSLVGDKDFLKDGINEIKSNTEYKDKSGMAEKFVKPYIQLVDDSTCLHTGYKLRDIWRYFRYTWSIPYKSTPGRNLFYLVRDGAQENHPIMGIAALGNSVLQLSHRDSYIGWNTESIKQILKKKTKTETYEEMIKGQLGLKRKVERVIELESDEEHLERVQNESKRIAPLLIKFLDEAIGDINLDGLISEQEVDNISEETIINLKAVAEDLKDKQLNNKRSGSGSKNIDWKQESMSPLYTKKRATELAKLLEAKLRITNTLESEENEYLALKKLLNANKVKSINVAMQANRRSKIGSNLMEIIVCGAIPPYNQLLSGKLVSILICSPKVIKDCNQKYSSQVSEIASRMKGEKVVRDSRLAFLGTTSLYYMGSSQYNRIKVPVEGDKFLEYKKLGETEGYGSVFFTQETTKCISRMVQIIDGGRKINNVFGEGTSPRLRLLRSGLSTLGISSEKYLNHHTRRIVYGIKLASNTSEFLKGETDNLDYLFPLDGKEEIHTEELINYWRERWFLKRIETVDILERLSSFEKRSIALSNYF